MLNDDKEIVSEVINFKPFALRPEILTLLVVFIILLSIFLTYHFKLKKQKVNNAPTGIVLLVQMYISYVRNLVVEILGYELECLTPYFLMLFSYILLCNVIGIMGWDNPTSSLTVTLSMGFVMFVGVFVIGFKYQKLSYLKKFCFCINVKGKKIPVMINPTEIISQVTPLISISFRLWGNIFAGGLISGLWYFLTGYICSFIPFIGAFNWLGGLTAPFLNMYFDLLCGVIQALVFTLLTMVYWTLAKGEENPNQNEVVKQIIPSNQEVNLTLNTK